MERVRGGRHNPMACPTGSAEGSVQYSPRRFSVLFTAYPHFLSQFPVHCHKPFPGLHEGETVEGHFHPPPPRVCAQKRVGRIQNNGTLPFELLPLVPKVPRKHFPAQTNPVQPLVAGLAIGTVAPTRLGGGHIVAAVLQTDGTHPLVATPCQKTAHMLDHMGCGFWVPDPLGFEIGFQWVHVHDVWKREFTIGTNQTPLHPMSSTIPPPTSTVFGSEPIAKDTLPLDVADRPGILQPSHPHAPALLNGIGTLPCLVRLGFCEDFFTHPPIAIRPLCKVYSLCCFDHEVLQSRQTKLLASRWSSTHPHQTQPALSLVLNR
jgi:hypothetical protein